MNLREAWEEQALAWAAWARTPGHDHFFWRYNLPRFLDIVPPAGETTLDLGCGEGRVARALAERGHHLIGVDGSPTLAHLASTHDDPFTVVVADAAQLPITAASVDQAIAFMSLQDIDDLDGAAREAGRVLEPGGCLCVAVLHPLETAGEFVDETFESPFQITSAYPQPRRFVDDVERDGLAMVFHSVHRPLESYASAFQRAGFVIEVLRESVPDDDYVRDHPRLQRQTRIPCYLHLRLRRQ